MQVLPIFIFCVVTLVSAHRDVFVMDKRWICTVKLTCLDCLRLPHCSWCETENKCFSRHLPNNICSNSNDTVIDNKDYGLSISENAECSCQGGKMESNCYPPGLNEGPECSGRGQCICGHCFCDSVPDEEFPTKTIMGDHCEYDNFSCDGPKCNEGPYSISQPVSPEEENDSKDAKIEENNDN